MEKIKFEHFLFLSNIPTIISFLLFEDSTKDRALYFTVEKNRAYQLTKRILYWLSFENFLIFIGEDEEKIKIK